MREAGVQVIVSTKDITEYSEAKELLNECLSLGPVGGVFNLAMVSQVLLIDWKVVVYLEVSLVKMKTSNFVLTS